MVDFFAKVFGPKKNRKKRFGLLGRHISYSLSPLMHKACYQELGIDADYKLFDIEMEKEDLPAKLTALVKREKLDGFNVTVPYKVLIKDFLENSAFGHLDPTALASGSVNTVKVTPGKWTGYSTDGAGFYLSLKKDLNLDPAGKTVIILGAGGAGRAVSMYLAHLDQKAPEKIFVYDKDPSKLSGLISAAKERSFSNVKSVESERDLTELLQKQEAELLVNATPVGTDPADPAPVDTDLLGGKIAVYDLVYAHRTALINAAVERGLPVADGKGMLASQGAIAFNIWLKSDIEKIDLCMKKVVSAEEL